MDEIKSCVKLTGYVNSTDDFIDQPVINGASDLLKKFLIKEVNIQNAISANSLLGVAVEVDAIFEIY